MPSLTFLNLKEDKQDKLIRAAINEFSKETINKASINQIIKEAHISRGSFYTYFDNIEDLYLYILNRHRLQMLKKIEELIKINKGDIIESFKDIINYISDYCMKDNNKAFFKNVFISMNSAREDLFLTSSVKKNCQHSNEHSYMLDLIDIDKLNITDKRDILDILEIIKNISMHTLITMFVFDESIDVVKEAYNRKLNILKRGIYKGGYN